MERNSRENKAAGYTAVLWATLLACQWEGAAEAFGDGHDRYANLPTDKLNYKIAYTPLKKQRLSPCPWLSYGLNDATKQRRPQVPF